jgi:hypothetical protein
VLDERWADEEQALADGLGALLGKACDPTTVREAEDQPDGRLPRLEAQLEAFGLWELPPDPGLLAAAAEQIGRALAPVPFPERAAVLAVTGIDAVWAERGWAPSAGLPAVAGGPDGELVDAMLGPARRSAAGDFVAAVATTGVTHETGTADRIRRLVRLLSAARAVGAAAAVIELGVAYSKERHQFGRPIGSFQAVAHRLADVATAIDGAVLAVRKAAWVARPAQGGDGAPDAIFVAIARWRAEEAAEVAVAAVHQIMGGIGFTVEADCQLYSRRIRAWRLRLEPVGPELADLARTLLSTEGRDATRWLWHHEQGLPLPRWAEEADA